MNSETLSVADVPILGWAWLLVDERTGGDYDRGFCWGEEKPNIVARKGTHFDYRAVIARHRALEETGEINDRVRTSRDIFHGPCSDELVAMVDDEEQAGSLVQEVPVCRKGPPGNEVTSAHLEAQGDVAKDERDTWTAGDCYKETYADHFEAGIDHHGEPRNVSTDGTWGHRIVCYGATEREAIDLRDKVLAAITTDAEAKP